MWDYLEHIAFVLSNIVNVLRVMSQSEAKLLRRSFTRRYTTTLKQRPAKTPRTKSIAVPFVTGDDGKLLPGMCMLFVSISVSESLSLSFTFILTLVLNLTYMVQ